MTEASAATTTEDISEETCLHEGFAALAAHYEKCLARHGTVPKGVDWPDGLGLATRYAVALGGLGIGSEKATLLDIGCGPGLLLDYLQFVGCLDRFDYRGIDLSERMIRAARQRWPTERFEPRDIIRDVGTGPEAEHVLLCGVLTVKRELGTQAMLKMAKELLHHAWLLASKTLTFNVMSPHVDWTRDDLFYWPYDDMSNFVAGELSKHFSVRADYALHEYMVTVRREPFAASADPWARSPKD